MGLRMTESSPVAGWPVRLTMPWRGSALMLRPLHHRRDRDEFTQLRHRNRAWTGPWDSTSPHPEPPMDFRRVVKLQDGEARAGRLLPWAIDVDGVLAGQVHVFSIVRGAQQSGTVGYWIGHEFAGRGLVPAAVAMAMDRCFGAEGLHRIEINVRPENANSLRVVAKLGLRDEGVRRNFLHIDGAWRDHRTFATTADEVDPGGMIGRLAQNS